MDFFLKKIAIDVSSGGLILVSFEQSLGLTSLKRRKLVIEEFYPFMDQR